MRDMSQSDSMLAHLKNLFKEVMQAISGGSDGLKTKTVFNAKGDRVKWFDIAADQAVCAYLTELFPCSVILMSEEGEMRNFGKGTPEFTMVLDPIDGSDNFDSGIPLAGMAVALIPADLPVSVDNVEYALVGDVFTEKTLTAIRRHGTYDNGIAVRTSQITRLDKALITCELNHYIMNSPLTGVLSRARGVRSFGCTTRALSMVATGILDAHLDLRHRLTPENFLAPSLIISEAGGLLTDPEGNPLPDIQNLTEKYSILASATSKLHESLIKQIKGECIL